MLCIEEWESYRKKRRLIEKEEVMGILTSGVSAINILTTELQDTLFKIQTGASSGAIYYVVGDCADILKTKDISEHVQIHHSTTFRYETVDIYAENAVAWLNALKILLARQESAINTLNRTGAINQKAVHRCIMPTPTNNWSNLDFCVIFDGEQCNSCCSIFKPGGMASHDGSLTCMQASAEKDLLDKNWHQVDDATHINAVKKAGVEFDIRATQYKMWIPGWIKDALESYPKSGYAGMKMSEYLLKMAPKDESK